MSFMARVYTVAPTRLTIHNPCGRGLMLEVGEPPADGVLSA